MRAQVRRDSGTKKPKEVCEKRSGGRESLGWLRAGKYCPDRTWEEGQNMERRRDKECGRQIASDPPFPRILDTHKQRTCGGQPRVLDCTSKPHGTIGGK